MRLLHRLVIIRSRRKARARTFAQITWAMNYIQDRYGPAVRHDDQFG